MTRLGGIHVAWLAVASVCIASSISIVVTASLLGRDGNTVAGAHLISKSSRELRFSNIEVGGALHDLKTAGVTEFRISRDRGRRSNEEPFFLNVSSEHDLQTSYRGVYHQVLPFTGYVEEEHLSVVLDQQSWDMRADSPESIQIISWLSHKAAAVGRRANKARGRVFVQYE